MRNTKSMTRKCKFVLLLAGLLCMFSAEIDAQEKAKVKIVHSDDLLFQRNETPPRNIFWGNVYITHGDVKMYCDSVVQYDTENRIEAFGNVHIINADTVHIYGNFLKYNGDIRLAEMRDSVKLHNKSITLTTQFLDFDLNQDVGYYFNGGKIVDQTNILHSKIGRYYTKQDLLFFKDSVKLYTPDYDLKSDTLKYNTISKIAFVLGPTTVENQTETLYSEDGWYNTQTGISRFFKNTKLNSKEYQVTGDTVFLDKNNEIARVFDHVELIDTLNNLIVRGHFLETFKSTEKALMTDSVVFIQIARQDSLFLHSDSLKITKDTLGFELIKAFHRVKFFRTDLQGKCDSLVYRMQDSSINLFTNPVLWMQRNQILADSIKIETQNEKVKYLHFRGSAFLSAKEDSLFYNQIKGRNMLAHVTNNQMTRLDVDGNGESLYYPKEDEIILGMNVAKSSKINIHIEENKIDRIIFIQKPDGNMYPLFEIKKEMLFLKNFRWFEAIRPKSKHDIFIWEDIAPLNSKTIFEKEDEK